MKKLPDISFIPVAKGQKQHFAQWLVFWRKEQEFKKIDHRSLLPPLQVINPPKRPVNVHPYENRPLRLGEIRLLAPHLTPEADEPVYVAVVSEWKPVGFLVAPFSRFTVPALTGELFTGWKEPRLRVLNVWNSYSLSPDALAESWLVDHLSPEECRVARAVFRHAMFGHDLEPALQDRIGPPIVHPEDPRLTYQQEELQRLAGLARIQAAQEPDEVEIDAAALIAEAEAICNAAGCEAMLGRADKLVNRAVILDRTGKACLARWTYTARADGNFVIEPDQKTAPATMWELEGIATEDAEKIAGATVLFVDTVLRRLVAEGEVDESGTIIAASTVDGKALGGQPFDAGNLMLLIILE